MVVAQAMASGVPIVTTRTLFSLSYMQENVHCLYVDKGDSVAISAAIIRLLQNPALRSKMSENNRLLAKQFGASEVVEEFLGIYSEMNWT